MGGHDVPHRPGQYLWHVFGLCILLASSQVFAQGTPSSTAAQVRTPEEFQQQVRLGTPHIVIIEHLNMTDTLPMKESVFMDAGMISIQKASNATGTQTIRVCSQPVRE
jgi:hypothetical protein